MPKWLLSIIEMALKLVGLPLAKKLFPMVPDSVWIVILAVLDHIDGSTDPMQEAVRFERAVKECTGVACKPTTKGLG